MTTFSSKRLILILSWVGLASIIILINSFVNPKYNHDTTSVLISLICLMNAGLLATGLLGINKKVRDIESEQWKYHFKEQNKEEISQFRRQISFQLQTETTADNQEELEIKQFNEQMERANTSWKGKTRADYSPFEEFHYLQHKIKLLKKISEVLSLFLSLSTGLLILNLQLFGFKIFLGYGALLLTLFLVLFYAASQSKKSRNMRQQIYPKSVRDFLKDVNVW
jgi:hypothetical protein